MSDSTPLDPRGQNMREKSARTLDEVREVPTATIRKALSGLEEALGGREVLAGILAQSAFTSDEEKFVAILGDPEESGTSLAKLLGVFGLSPARFFKMLADAKAVKATFASMDHVYRRLPDVAEHTMERAVPKRILCHTCEGSGHGGALKPGEEKKKCSICGGSGFADYTPELDDVKLALQVGGLLKGGNSVTVTNQVDARSVTMNGPLGSPASDQRAIFKDFSQASDRILYGRIAAIPAEVESTTKTVDAEIVPKEEGEG